MLKATKPEPHKKRLKLFMFGDAGVGKTTAACALPKPYIIDAEKGTDNYSELINSLGGAVFQTTSIDEVISEIRSLATEEHGFKTLVIDPISPLFFDLLDKCELEVGAEFGRHYGEANKHMKRLVGLLMQLDMNVVMTSHSKPVYGSKMEVTGNTFDAWKRLPYMFDLVLELKKQTPTQRHARVVKTRIESFPDGETFAWGIDEIGKRYDLAEIDRSVQSIKLATKEEIADVESLCSREFLLRCLEKAGVETLADMKQSQVRAMIAHTKEKELQNV